MVSIFWGEDFYSVSCTPHKPHMEHKIRSMRHIEGYNRRSSAAVGSLPRSAALHVGFRPDYNRSCPLLTTVTQLYPLLVPVSSSESWVYTREVSRGQSCGFPSRSAARRESLGRRGTGATFPLRSKLCTRPPWSGCSRGVVSAPLRCASTSSPTAAIAPRRPAGGFWAHPNSPQTPLRVRPFLV